MPELELPQTMSIATVIVLLFLVGLFSSLITVGFFSSLTTRALCLSRKEFLAQQKAEEEPIEEEDRYHLWQHNHNMGDSFIRSYKEDFDKAVADCLSKNNSYYAIGSYCYVVDNRTNYETMDGESWVDTQYRPAV